MILGATAKPSEARKEGEGTCNVCHSQNVLTSFCKASQKNYCRNVHDCRKGAGLIVGEGSGVRKATGAERGR